jgi:hypothetical protein
LAAVAPNCLAFNASRLLAELAWGISWIPWLGFKEVAAKAPMPQLTLPLKLLPEAILSWYKSVP